MNLQDFVKNVLIDINAGVDDARAQTSRDIHFTSNGDHRTVEFDVAVTVGEVDQTSGKAGINVLKFAEAGANASRERHNSTVSRVTFGVMINAATKEETKKSIEANRQANSNRSRTLLNIDPNNRQF